MAARFAPVCPLCGEAITGEVSYDHVFGEAFGGRFLVATHKACNNDLGGGAEGELHRSYSFLNLIKMVNGLNGQPMPATTTSGRDVEVDLAAQKVEPRAPVVEKDPATGAVVRVAGNERQLRPILDSLRKRNPAIPEFDDLTKADYEIVTEPDGNLELNLRFDFAAAERVGAEAALGCGVKAFGEEFATTPLAGALRNVLHGDVDDATPVAPELASSVQEALTPYTEALVAQGKPIPSPLVEPGYTNDCVFIPAGDSTSVLVKVCGMTVLSRCLQGRLPARGDGLERDVPVIVRDDPYHDRVVVDYFDALILELGGE